MFGMLRRAATSVASVVVLTAVLAGRSGSSTIAGFVRDARGAPIPGVYRANLDLQHELTPTVVVEAGYIGNIGDHLTSKDFSIDQAPPELMGPGVISRARQARILQLGGRLTC